MREPWHRFFFRKVGTAAMTRRPALQPPRSVFRPWLEPLEVRTLLSAGDLDPTFGMGGQVITDFPHFTNASAVAAAVQPDSKIVVAGSADGSCALTRYNPDGSLDTSFGLGGRVTTSSGTAGFAVGGLAIQSDGKIVVAGGATVGSFGVPYLVMNRYQADGSLDVTFGIGGMVTLTGASQGSKVLIQPDGKIVVAGSRFGHFIETPITTVVRFNPDGSPDGSFGSGGVVTLPPPVLDHTRSRARARRQDRGSREWCRSPHRQRCSRQSLR